jgi:hypothetical protein
VFICTFFFLFFLVPSLFFPWLVSVTFNVHYPVLGCGPRMYCALC